jgi:hypothetical protein
MIQVTSVSARRRMGRSLALAGLAILFPLALGGCAGGAAMTDMWNDASFTARPVQNVLVVALRKDPVRRRLWEDAFVSELKARGVSATASYSMFVDVPDTEAVIQAVKDKGFGAVLANARLEPGTETQVIPGYVSKQPVTRYNRWTNTYHTYLLDVLTPDRIDSTTVQRFRTDMWSGGQLVWSGTLEVTEAPNASVIDKNVSKRIVPALEEIGLVPKRRS